MNDSNSDIEEQVFDYLLEEALNGPEPPDLSTDILCAWNEEQIAEKASQSGKIVSDESKIIAKKVRPGREVGLSGSESSTPENVALDKAATENVSVLGVSRQRFGWVVSLATVAVGLLLVICVKILNEEQSGIVQGPLGPSEITNGEIASTADSDSNDAPRHRNSDVPEIATPDSASLASGSSVENPSVPVESSESTSKELDLDSIPFNVDTPPAQVVENSRPVKELVEPAQRLEPKVLLAELNQRMKATWSSVGIRPTNPLSSSELKAKIERLLTGIPSELSSRSVETDEDFDSYVFAKGLVEGGEFPNHWARLVTDQWLRKGSLSLQDSEGVGSLRKFLARNIADKESWSDVSGELIGGELPKETQGFRKPNEAFYSALLGGGNHRFVNRIGVNFLNQNLACVRCHSSGSTNGNSFETQGEYWSFVAMWSGLDARGAARQGSRFLFNQQADLFGNGNEPEVFFGLPNGKLKAARALLPGGKEWKHYGQTPRDAFVSWLASSPAFDQAVVNQTWKLVFGRRLIPTVEGIDVLAIEERKLTLEFLAQQFRSHGRDVGELVNWLVASEAFAKSTPTDEGKWLIESEESLQNQQLAEHVFASGTTLGRSSTRNLESSLTVLAKWGKRSNNRSMDSIDVTLAQPDLSKSDPSKAIKTDVAFPPLSFSIHGERVMTAERDYVQKLLKSRLSWEQSVSHIVMLSEYEKNDQRTQQMARSLLDRKGGDAEAALLALLWAVKDSM